MPETTSQTMDRILPADAAARKLASGQTTLTRLIARKLLRHPLSSLGWIAGGGLSLAAFANIMLLQPERHRAPLFVGNPLVHATPLPIQTPLPQPRPANLEKDVETMRRAELMHDIQLELARRGFFIGDPDPAATAKTTQAIRSFQSAAALPVTGQITEGLLASVLTSNLRVKDQIAGLLRNTGDRLERPATVVAVQRALSKLGYGPLRDDGHFGASTRIALDKFEKDRKLPARGESPTRVLKELSQASGIAIE